MSLKSGYWYNKGEKFALYNFQGDEFHNKNMVCLDCPGIKDFMSGKIKHGDFGPAHEDIIAATGVQNYNFCLASEVAGAKQDYHGVLNTEGDQIHLWGLWGKMEVINWLNEEEKQKLAEDREPAEAPNCSYFQPQPENQGKLLWFSGPPGAGKSTTAQRMARSHGYVYYEADCFFMFVNPFVDINAEEASLAMAAQKPLKGIDEESIMIIDKASEVEEELMQGKLDGVEGKLEPMYKIMAKDLIKQRNRLGGNWAIAQAVFSRKQRELLRNIIGPDLVFIVISMTKECNAQRIKKRGNMGEYADALIKYAELCEPAGDDEENAYNVVVTEDMSIDDVMGKVLEIVQKL